MTACTFLALDLETGGLDPQQPIIEIAYVVLDEGLTEVGYHHALIPGAYRQIEPGALEIHQRTGLLSPEGLIVARGDEATASIEEEAEYLIRVLQAFSEKPILLGASVHFDRSFLRHHMPEAERLLSHRHLDTSSLKLAFPDLKWPEQTEGQHRALPDVRYSIELARYARKVMNR